MFDKTPKVPTEGQTVKDNCGALATEPNYFAIYWQIRKDCEASDTRWTTEAGDSIKIPML